MTDSHAIEAEDVSPVWPLRPLLLALLGLATGLAVHLIIGKLSDYQLSPALLAELAFVTVTAGLIGFTIERRYWWASIAFAVAMGAIAAGVVWWNGAPDQWSGGDGWRGASLVLAIGIAAPLFQAARDEGRLHFPYPSVHDYVWSNLVLWGACWMFVGISFALSYLLAGLFELIKLSFLSELLRKDWFWRALIGVAFGGALGILREHSGVVRLLQRVVTIVLAVLAPVLAVGLIVFVLALPFTGLAPLWEAGSATGILLACILGSFVLANAVIGSAADEERQFPLLKYGAMGLALVMLPLGVIAAIAIGLRIGQYGFTPERLWALTFVILACAYGVAYLVSLRGRLDWAAKVRPANLNLAMATCAVALLLATPLVSFNAIATHDQVARLESGKLSPEKFDWRALAFEFGEPGKAALKKLQASPNAAIKDRATEVAKIETRWGIREMDEQIEARKRVAANLRILPSGTSLPQALRDAIARNRMCTDTKCTLLLISDRDALLFHDGCFTPPLARDPSALTAQGCWKGTRYSVVDGAWQMDVTSVPAHPQDKLGADYAAGDIQVRTVPRRQVFVGDVPIGEPFE